MEIRSPCYFEATSLAWYYTRYGDDPYWAKLEYTARLQKKGLWVMPHPTSPWDYRKLKAQKRLRSNSKQIRLQHSILINAQ
jgi:hypothetical protein